MPEKHIFARKRRHIGKETCQKRKEDRIKLMQEKLFIKTLFEVLSLSFSLFLSTIRQVLSINWINDLLYVKRSMCLDSSEDRRRKTTRTIEYLNEESVAKYFYALISFRQVFGSHRLNSFLVISIESLTIKGKRRRKEWPCLQAVK